MASTKRERQRANKGAAGLRVKRSTRTRVLAHMHGMALRSWLGDRQRARDKAVAKAREAQSKARGPRGVDRVPERYRVARPEPAVQAAPEKDILARIRGDQYREQERERNRRAASTRKAPASLRTHLAVPRAHPVAGHGRSTLVRVEL